MYPSQYTYIDDGPTLGCFYSAMGINRELCNDPNLAYKYHKKALEVWNQCKQNGFIVITLRRLITYLCVQYIEIGPVDHNLVDGDEGVRDAAVEVYAIRRVEGVECRDTIQGLREEDSVRQRGVSFI